MLAATATLVFILILAFIACIVLSVGYDIALWGLWGSADILTTVAAQWINIIPYAIWMFPVFAWLMLASMFANKVPFLWATLPVVIIILVEAFVVQHFSLSHSVISQTLRDYFNFVIRFEPGDIRDIQSVGFYMTKKLFSKVGY
jgi:ABC-2 type transport system permease protein